MLNCHCLDNNNCTVKRHADFWTKFLEHSLCVVMGSSSIGTLPIAFLYKHDIVTISMLQFRTFIYFILNSFDILSDLMRT